MKALDFGAVRKRYHQSVPVVPAPEGATRVAGASAPILPPAVARRHQPFVPWAGRCVAGERRHMAGVAFLRFHRDPSSGDASTMGR
jgi:hypothetical protein